MQTWPALRNLHRMAPARPCRVGVVEDEERRVAAELERELHDLAGALRHQDLADHVDPVTRASHDGLPVSTADRGRVTSASPVTT